MHTRVELFVAWAQSQISKLQPCECVLSFDEWLANCRYTTKAKDRLRQCIDSVDKGLTLPGNPAVKDGFPKTERYPKYKHFRGIAACTLYQKAFVGPCVKSVELAVYKQWAPYFLKGIETSSRARELTKRLGVGRFLGLDFSSFESSILREYSVGIESYLFDHMAKTHCPDVCRFLRAAARSDRVIRYRGWSRDGVVKGWTVKLHHGRCSGDMFTSLCNAVINMLLVRFVCRCYGYDPLGVVEGDDGLFKLAGPAPHPDDFAALGFTAKAEIFTDLGVAGFCKMKFDENCVQITDPVERLVKFGWTTSFISSPRVRWSLLWTKALSLKAEFPNCPILGPFADWVISCCRSAGWKLEKRYDEDPGWTSWKVEHGSSLFVPSVVPRSARLFMESLFQISVPEQCRIEAGFCGPLRYLEIPEIIDRCPSVWSECWQRYVEFGPLH